MPSPPTASFDFAQDASFDFAQDAFFDGIHPEPFDYAQDELRRGTRPCGPRSRSGCCGGSESSHSVLRLGSALKPSSTLPAQAAGQGARGRRRKQKAWPPCDPRRGITVDAARPKSKGRGWRVFPQRPSASLRMHPSTSLGLACPVLAPWSACLSRCSSGAPGAVRRVSWPVSRAALAARAIGAYPLMVVDTAWSWQRVIPHPDTISPLEGPRPML